MENDELRYIDHIKAKASLAYDKIDNVLRNIHLRPEDIDSFYGLFNEVFYNRDDVSKTQKVIIQENEKVLRELIENNEQLDKSLFLR